MALITAGITTSHVPAIGAAIDLGKTEEDYWRPVFAGYEWTKRWIMKPEKKNRKTRLPEPEPSSWYTYTVIRRIWTPSWISPQNTA